MPHDIEILPDGSASVYQAREPSWHGLGVVVPEGLGPRDALKAAQLDWTVESKPVYHKTTDGFKPITDRFALVRDRDEKALGVVSDRYVPLQNVEAFDFLSNLVDDGELIIESAGALDGGRRTFVTCKVPKQWLVAGEEVYDVFLFLRNAFDGGTSVSVRVTPVKVVCANTESLAIRQHKSVWSVPHTTGVHRKVAQARESLKLTLSYADEFAKELERLAEREMSDGVARSILARPDVLGSVGAGDAQKVDSAVSAVIHNRRNSKTISEAIRPTALGVYSAFTEQTEWKQTFRTKEARLRSTLDGTLQQRREALARHLSQRELIGL